MNKNRQELEQALFMIAMGAKYDIKEVNNIMYVTVENLEYDDDLDEKVKEDLDEKQNFVFEVLK